MTNGKKVKLSVFAVIIILIAIIILQNMAAVTIHVLFWNPFTLSTALLLFITALIGFVIGILFKYIFFKKKKQ